MAPSKVRVFHTLIEYNGLGRWKRKKDGPNQGRPFQLFSSGGRTRTSDLRVMSPTSYQLLYSAVYWTAKV